ncbi:hypothetical protein HDU86_006802 [Geranomyces michiganensis]|nr:hypothetical protein HDU86_006802 [Geranomyces michiganensis]
MSASNNSSATGEDLRSAPVTDLPAQSTLAEPQDSHHAQEVARDSSSTATVEDKPKHEAKEQQGDKSSTEITKHPGDKEDQPSKDDADAAATKRNKKVQEMSQPVHEELLAEEPPTHNRIVAIAVDQSDHSEYSVTWAMDHLLNKSTDQVVLLNVRDVVNVPASFGLVYLADIRGAEPLDWLDETEKEYMEASHKLLKYYGNRILKAGIKCRAIALRGDPREEIIHKTAEINADMLVIGSRGMGTIKR